MVPVYINLTPEQQETWHLVCCLQIRKSDEFVVPLKLKERNIKQNQATISRLSVTARFPLNFTLNYARHSLQFLIQCIAGLHLV